MIFIPVDEDQIEASKERIRDNENILEENKKLIFDFDRHLVLNDYSLARRYKYIIRLPKFAEQLDVSFDEAVKRDIEDLIMWIQKKDDISDRTRSDYKVLLKRFYRWIGGGEYPEKVEWIKPTHNHSNDKLPDDLLTEDDVKKLIKSAKNPRDKAIIAMLWETGARIGELIDLEVDSFEDHRHGLKVVIDGKTGSRRVPLIESVPHITAWLNSHPRRDEKNAPLWVNIGTRNNGQKYSYRSLNKMLNETAQRAGIDKPTNPHHFRHSRATYMANRFTEAQLCEWFGWVQGSDVPARYVHLSGRDIDSSYARLHGIEEEKDKEISEMAPEDCPRCRDKVPPNADFCHRCGQALSIKGMEEVEEDQDDFKKSFTQLAKEQPELLDDMEEFFDIIKIMKENKETLEDFKRIIEKEKE